MRNKKKIKEIYPKKVLNSFKFELVTKDNIKNEIQKLNVKNFQHLVVFLLQS